MQGDSDPFPSDHHHKMQKIELQHGKMWLRDASTCNLFYFIFKERLCIFACVERKYKFLIWSKLLFFFCPLFFLFDIKIFHICFWADLFKAFNFYLSLVQNMREIVPMSGRKEWTLELIYGGGSYSSSSSSSFSSFLFF